MLWDPQALDSLDGAAIGEVLQSWAGFCDRTDALLRGRGDLSAGADLVPFISSLCRYGLDSLVQDHFLHSLEEAFKSDAVLKFWKQFDAYYDISSLGATKFHENWIEEVLSKSLEEICLEKDFQEKCLLMLVHALQSYEESTTEGLMKIQDHKSILTSKYQLMVSSILLTTLPMHFPEILRMYFKGKLEELSNMMAVDHEEDACEFQRSQGSQRSSKVGEMDIDTYNHGPNFAKDSTLVYNIGKVVRDLRSLGFTSMTEDAYASSILLLLKDKVHDLAGDDYRNPVLGSIKEWIQLVNQLEIT
ncbi:hypothetical protein Cni_G09127 [Canna indica]|uniref:Anaphase-promoting complex subunit 2 n=1 Tax=Canna indica TaxID=4628 RepID=A0AAQ3K1Q7_9LILI|nr:hypothetical protein Cni_G09127 [Canna indica]